MASSLTSRPDARHASIDEARHRGEARIAEAAAGYPAAFSWASKKATMRRRASAAAASW